jgi:quercetin dioxygenase-like cupin family protein
MAIRVAGHSFHERDFVMRKLLVVIALLVGAGLSGAVAAQQSGAATPSIKRTPLQKVDVPGANYEAITGIAEIAANTNIGRHTHPGAETGYILEGEFTLLVDGQAPLSLKQGDSYKVPPGAIHDARTGARPAKVLAVYVVEKGKPLATSAE